jgi:hypothetical protein
MANFEDINSGHFLEVMDRLHIISTNIQDHILDHPLIEQNKDLEITKHIDDALYHLYQAYQFIANLEDEFEKLD